MGSMGLIGLMSLMGLIVLMAACSQGDPVVPGGNETEQGANAIAFSADLPELQEITRSTPLEETGITSFKVWGVKDMSYTDPNYGDPQTVFPGYIVDWIENTAYTTTTDTHDWEYLLLAYPNQTIKYWDWSAKAYRYFAVAPSTAGSYCVFDDNGTPAVLEDDSYKFTMTADANIPENTHYYSRLWFSDNTTKPYGQPVVLEFTQPFADVRFKFTYSDPTADPLPMLEEPDFRPNTAGQRIAVKGTVVIIYPVAGVEKEEQWTSTADPSKYLISLTQPNKWYTVLPIVNQGAYILKVTVNGEDKTCVVPATFMDWKPGYNYTYIFKISDEGGIELDSVKIGVKSWESGKEGSHIIYNW